MVGKKMITWLIHVPLFYKKKIKKKCKNYLKIIQSTNNQYLKFLKKIRKEDSKKESVKIP